MKQDIFSNPYIRTPQHISRDARHMHTQFDAVWCSDLPYCFLLPISITISILPLNISFASLIRHGLGLSSLIDMIFFCLYEKFYLRFLFHFAFFFIQYVFYRFRTYWWSMHLKFHRSSFLSVR